ncbi:hypothetical protein BYT27DRAFT_7187995 [Phlegmacium glaucopus]|nr:hypothetical protein BYT27DRAFT_7187995 [Phlegmacium glaucopus]
MPLHLASASSSSSSLSSKTASPLRRLPPLNIMRSLSLCRKSRPTCTLSLAHVSACKPTPPSSDDSSDEEAMQVDTLQLDLNTIHFVAVPMPLPASPKSLRRTKTKTTINDINVIPFPTSTKTTITTTTTHGSPSPAGSNSHAKRQNVHKKEDSEHPSTTVSASISPPRKRARKGSLTTTPPSSSRSTPSARARALAQRVPPARPSSPTPDSRSPNAASIGDELETQDASDKWSVKSSPVDLEHHTPDSGHQQESQDHQGRPGQDLDKHGQTELPPYCPSPPPYSPPVVAPMPITSPTPIHASLPLSTSSSPTSSTTTSESSTPQPQHPPPPPPPSPSPPPRKPRISPSELKFFIFLYRTLVSGLEMRQQRRLNTQVRRAPDWSRREHLDGVLVEVDDDVDDDGDAAAMMDNELTPSLNEDLEVQDALLALRLRGFLKWNGVDEWVLKVDSSTSETSPFLDDGVTRSSSSDKMDVDVQTNITPPLSSRHLITVLRMRGSCGPRQGPGLGFKSNREKSKLRTCCYQAEDEVL